MIMLKPSKEGATKMERKSILRGLVILGFIVSCLVVTMLRRSQEASANETCWYYVVIVTEGYGGTHEDCHVTGTGCSSVSCGDARYLATQSALAELPPQCSSLTYHYEYEYSEPGCIP
jgi:hypothetical protein